MQYYNTVTVLPGTATGTPVVVVDFARDTVTLFSWLAVKKVKLVPLQSITQAGHNSLNGITLNFCI
jgi:hypothetical protein